MFCFSKRAKTRRELFLRLIGVGCSTPWALWFTFLILASQILSLVVLLGCKSPSMNSLYLFRIDRDELIDSTIGKTKIKADVLNLDELPLHWSWGLSGVCAEYLDETVSCRQTLLPMTSLEDSIKFSVEETMRLEGSAISIEERIRPWTEALEEIRTLTPPIARTRALWKAGVVLTITSALLSSLLSLSGILLVSVLRGKVDRWILYAGAILDSMLLITAGTLFIYATRSSPRALLRISEVKPVEPKDYIGGAFVFLFMSASFKLASIGLVFAAICLPEVFIADFCCHRKRKPPVNLEGACAIEK